MLSQTAVALFNKEKTRPWLEKAAEDRNYKQAKKIKLESKKAPHNWKTRLLNWVMSLSLLVLLSACMLPAGTDPLPGGLPIPDPAQNVPQSGEEAPPPNPFPGEATQAQPVIATHVPDPTPTQPHQAVTPVNQAPSLVFVGLTNVRTGPGLDYEVMFEMGSGITAPILGRNEAATWFAIPGPGDGSGPQGWVSGSVVSLQGDILAAPVLPAPPLPAPIPSVPVILDPGSPPTNVCTANHPGGNQVINVHLGPGAHFGLAAVLGNWAEVISTQADWHQILIAPGESGWVAGDQVLLAGPCSSAPPPPPCFVTAPAGSQPVQVHLGPGDHFGPNGFLTSTAELLGREGDWYQIQLGPGMIGWVPVNLVELSGECP